MSRRKNLPRQAAVAAVAVTAVAGLTLSGIPQGTALSSHSDKASEKSASFQQPSRERKGAYDSRVGSLKVQLREAAKTIAARGPAFKQYAKSLGNEAVLDYDAITGTPRNLGRLDGFLTGPSSASARAVAMTYVRGHLGVLGLSRADLKTFGLARDYVDVTGIHHLSWTQSAGGRTLFGNGLKANVSKRGELISLQGSPVSGLSRLAKRTDAGTLSASQARSAAAADVGGKAAVADVASIAKSGEIHWANYDYAKPVWIMTTSGLRAGWSTYVQAGGDNLNYQHVIDAKSGSVLYRHDNVDNDKGDALVYENYPGAPRGGKQHVVNLIKKGFVAKSAKYLSGPHVIAWADINDDDVRNPNERVAVPGTRNAAQYRFHSFPDASDQCSPDYLCTWDPAVANSWRKNLRADVTQGFYFDNIYARYLEHAPFGFTPAAGNFKGADPVLLHSLDGANTDSGFPDGNHVNNANMSTPPDGIPPTMQMFLFDLPGAWIPASSDFDPGIIFHEYTHGLSNRLVVDATGNSTLNSVQARSMGEAWSDYYAMDYLVTKGYEKDTAKPGQILMTEYVNTGIDSKVLRTMPLDCPVGTTSQRCGDLFGGFGGYTYGDFAGIIGIPEVHASGEIWAQMLWDMRNALGHRVTANVVTRGMELSADDPTFLDMRNAILQADNAVYDGNHRTQLWRVFANRGMGFFAGTLDASDGFPDEDFSMPPAPNTPRATLSGQVVDGLTAEPVAGAIVAITGHNSGYTGDYTTMTDAGGRYTLPFVLVGTYPSVVVLGPGYEVIEESVTVEAGGTTADFEPRRDWAASESGGQIADFNGPDLTPFGCGPAAALDLSQGTGWGSTTGDDNGTPTNVMIPKFIVVELPETIDVTSFAVDPSHLCGDPGSSSTGDYRIETSSNGTDWDVADEGTFDATNRYIYNEITPGAPIEDVSFVRFTMLSPQVPDFETNCPGPFGGCSFTDMAEIEVFGSEIP